MSPLTLNGHSIISTIVQRNQTQKRSNLGSQDMAGRPVDQQRRDELLDAVIGYAVEHGFAELTWRPLAAALGVTPTTLVHRFGSKEQMIQAVQQRLRERIITETAAGDGEELDLPAYVRRVWERVSDPARDGEFRLFFAVYGQALQAPEAFAD